MKQTLWAKIWLKIIQRKNKRKINQAFLQKIMKKYCKTQQMVLVFIDLRKKIEILRKQVWLHKVKFKIMMKYK